MWGFQAEEVKRRYTEAVEAAEGTDQLVYVLAEAVMVLGKSLGPRGVTGWSERLRALSDGLPAGRRTEVDLAWGTVAAFAGDPSGTDTIRSALGLANVASVMRSAPPAAFPFMLAAAFDSRLFVEQFEEADELFKVAWQVAEHQGAVLHMRMLAGIQAAGNWWRGHLIVSRQMLEEIAATETEGGYPAARGARGDHDGDDRSGGRGRPEGGLGVRPGRGTLAAGNPWARTQLWRVEAELAIDAGRAVEAAELGRNMRDLAERMGVLEPCWTPWADTAMIAFLGAGLLTEAQALVEHLDRVTERVPCRWPRSVADLGRAGLAEAEGRPESAEEHYSSAVEILEGIDIPLRRARALLFLRAVPPPNGPPRSSESALSSGSPRERGLWRHEVCFPGTSRAASRWGPAPAGQLDGAERPGAQRGPDGGSGLDEWGDRFEPLHIGQDGRAPPDVGVLEARGPLAKGPASLL